MKTLGLLVGENNWTHVQEIAADLAAHFRVTTYRPRTYQLPVLAGRLNAWSRRSQIQHLLGRNDVCFFEWASDLLCDASGLPRKAKVVTRLHSFELYTWAPRIDWGAVDRVIVVSEAMRRAFVERFPDHASKVTVIYNGVSMERFTRSAERPFRFAVGMLCGISPVKRVYEMILVHAQLRGMGHPARLHIGGAVRVGEERYAAAVHGLVARLGLADSVIFHGHVADTPRWLHNIDIFVSHSFWEGQQVALLEAMASGCQCFAHHWPGADEVLPAAHLYTTDEELLARILSDAARSEEERRASSEAMWALACERFDISLTKRRIRQELEEAPA